MKAPLVYKAINAVAAELAHVGIPKTNTNLKEQYQYRSIDDVLNRLSPLLAKHGLCVLPRVLERIAVDRQSAHNTLLVSVGLKVAFDLVSSRDGSRHRVKTFGEALDEGDKATAKAMSAAYKAAMLQTFCIPLAGNEDGDADSPKLGTRSHQAEPVQGWEQWSRDIAEMVGVCETQEALARVQNSNRALLKAIGRERPDLYAALGDAFGARKSSLAAPIKPSPQTKRSRPTSGSMPHPNRASTKEELVHA